jgi:CoA-transferase family III
MATSSIEGADRLLEGWAVECARDAPAPLVAARELLVRFGGERCDVAGVSERSDGRPARRSAGARGAAPLWLCAPGGRPSEVHLAGWIGERALPESLRPTGSVLTAYAGLRAAAAAVVGARRGGSVTLGSESLVRELTAALRHAGPSRPQLVRCRDGWAVARWRDEHEPQLLRALVGPEGASARADTVAAAHEARLLVGAIRRPPPGAPRALGGGSLDGAGRKACRRPRVVDWTVLWAGPWAAQELRGSGALVERIEHPRRRDGLLAWPAGRAWWRRLNSGKRLSLLDVRREGDRARVERSLTDADVLLTSMTPRALRSLGFDDAWRREHAPRLLHVELVAFEEPWADAPGLGEHAAAEAGLLWGGRTPYPWADPLLGALALLVARVWLASDRARGGRVRLSLERAASLAFDIGGLNPGENRHRSGTDSLHPRLVA